jgi:hypothetical protein
MSVKEAFQMMLQKDTLTIGGKFLKNRETQVNLIDDQLG